MEAWERLLEIYGQNWNLPVQQLIALVAFIYALVTIRKHMGVSLCVIFCFLIYSAYWFLAYPFELRSHVFFDYLFDGLWIVYGILMYVAIFGWRKSRAAMEGVRFAAASSPDRETLPIGYQPVRISWSLWGVLLCLSIISILLSVPMLAVAESGDMEALLVLTTIQFILGIIAVVLGMVIIFSAWKAIQDGNASTTPGKAVGFMFIPFFNLYWVFVALAGFAKDCNTFIERHQITADPLPNGLYTMQCILIVLSVIITRIPVVGLLYSIPVSIIGIIIMHQLTSRVNAIYENMISVNETMPLSPTLEIQK